MYKILKEMLPSSELQNPDSETHKVLKKKFTIWLLHLLKPKVEHSSTAILSTKLISCGHFRFVE